MWPRTADELVAAQRELAAAVPVLWRPPATARGQPAETLSVRRSPEAAGGRPGETLSVRAEALAVGACVVAFPRGKTGAGAAGDPAFAAATVLRGREVLAAAVVAGEAGAPYAPGLLALREGPLHAAAVRALAQPPDVLLVDATGRDHPRRAGLALHLGAVLDLPTVGVTHRPLLATGNDPDDVRGATAPLTLDGEPVGAWLRTRRGARPVAVHPGWRTDTETAVAIVLAATARHRTPEPIRHARRLAREARSVSAR